MQARVRDAVAGIHGARVAVVAERHAGIARRLGDTTLVLAVVAATVAARRWWPSSGRRNDWHDDVLVCGSRSLPGDLVLQLDSYDTRYLVPYHPDYLAGFSAERYVVTLEAAHLNGRQAMARVQYARCGRDVPGDTHRNLNVANRFTNETYKHVLLPVWYVSYRFKKRAYAVLVNGQTGQVEGDAPRSWVKILFVILLIAGIAIAIFIYADRSGR